MNTPNRPETCWIKAEGEPRLIMATVRGRLLPFPMVYVGLDGPGVEYSRAAVGRAQSPKTPLSWPYPVVTE